MSQTWSIIVIALVVLNILGCLWLLFWTAKRRPGEAADTGHVWDGDLREYNNPLPRWWLNLFILTVVFGLGYLAFYPGLGNFGGKLGWTSAGQHDAALAKVIARRDEIYAGFKGRDIASLTVDPAAHAQGAKLFEANCAGCHGADASGAKGFPNLRDGDWLYGGSAEQVFTTITSGRNGQMPSFFGTMDDTELKSLIAFVRAWHSGSPESPEEAAGHKKFSVTCAACHGAEGKGNPMLGAPNLTDNIWLHGSTPEDIRQTILFGRKSQMPAFGDLLDDTQRRLLAAYVIGLSSEPK